jgi:2-methylisocitrate lyase-like PEP mutase family enzyme
LPTVAEKRRSFRALHESGCFVLPNPWDVGSARYLQSLGFKALATTSAGAAWVLGYPDGGLPLDAMLDHCRAIVGATDLPVNADFLTGYASAPEGVAKNVARCIDTGVAGLSIEDATGDKREPLFDFVLAVERIVAARRAVDAAGGGAILVARAECFLTGHPEPLKEAIKRLTAFAEAGADCLYAPGPRTRAEIKAIVDAVAPKPVNILARNLDRLTVADLAELGVRRVSVGGLMARMAWTGLMRSARELAANGTFDGFDGAVSGGDINALFATPRGPS